MHGAVDLSTTGIASRRLREECQGAADRLRHRASVLERRARQRPAGSNGRNEDHQAAKHLLACAALLESDTEYGDRIRRALQASGAVNTGWQQLARGVTILAQKFRAEYDHEHAEEQQRLRDAQLKVNQAIQDARRA